MQGAQTVESGPSWSLLHADGPKGLVSHGPIDHAIVDTTRQSPQDARACDPHELASAVAYQCRRWAVVVCQAISGPHMEHSGWLAWLHEAGMVTLGTGVWVQLGCRSSREAYPDAGHACIILAHSKQVDPRWNGGNKPAVWHAIDRAQLFRQLVEDFTDAGETVADPCAGDGVVGVAAVGLGRRYVGWTLRQSDYEAAKQRLSVPLLEPRNTIQEDLFGRVPKSMTGRARHELDVAVHNALSCANGEGLSVRDLEVRIDASSDEIYRSVKRLKRKRFVRSEGRTSNTRYFAETGKQP